MKNYFKENYEALLNKGDFYKYIEKEECEECIAFSDLDTKGNEIIGIEKNGRNWFFGSRYDNEIAINAWCDSVNLASYRAVLCVFGLGDYRTIQRMIDKYSENPIIVYEPNLSYFKNVLESYDLTELINRSNIAFFAGKEGFKYFKDMIFVNLDITNYKLSVFKYNMQYRTLYPQEIEKWDASIQDCVSTILVDKNTYIKYADERLDNSLKNYYDCTKSKSLLELIDVIKSNRSNTAILVSAGPSLDKNIGLLKKVKNKAMILAVDTAIKPVLSAGIVPDLTITVDSHKPKELFVYNKEFVDIPMVVCLQSNAQVVSKYKGKKFYFYNLDKSFYNVYKNDDYMDIYLDTGGSVANDAFSFLIKCGFENIIFIGQDLAYSKTKTHAGNAYDDETIVKFEKSDKHFLVEDIYGEQVYTEQNMNLYKKWFERNISNYNKINFIDATEGGAKIVGTKILTFAEAIEQYVNDLPITDYENLIKGISDLDVNEFNARMDRLKSIPDEIRETKNKLTKAMRLYDELEKLNRENKHNSSRISKLSKEIDKLTTEIEESIYVAFLSNIVDDTDYDVLENIYDDKESLYEEIKLIIDSGRTILNKYIDKYDEVSNKIFDMVEDAIKKYNE